MQSYAKSSSSTLIPPEQASYWLIAHHTNGGSWAGAAKEPEDTFVLNKKATATSEMGSSSALTQPTTHLEEERAGATAEKE